MQRINYGGVSMVSHCCWGIFVRIGAKACSKAFHANVYVLKTGVLWSTECILEVYATETCCHCYMQNDALILNSKLRKIYGSADIHLIPRSCGENVLYRTLNLEKNNPFLVINVLRPFSTLYIVIINFTEDCRLHGSWISCSIFSFSGWFGLSRGGLQDSFPNAFHE
jgi:hypothetical protein